MTSYSTAENFARVGVGVAGAKFVGHDVLGQDYGNQLLSGASILVTIGGRPKLFNTIDI